MKTVFATQLDDTVMTRVVTFVVMEDDGRETVESWKKKSIDTITDKYDYVATEKGRLPRFIRK